MKKCLFNFPSSMYFLALIILYHHWSLVTLGAWSWDLIYFYQTLWIEWNVNKKSLVSSTNVSFMNMIQSRVATNYFQIVETKFAKLIYKRKVSERFPFTHLTHLIRMLHNLCFSLFLINPTRLGYGVANYCSLKLGIINRPQLLLIFVNT